MVLHTVTCERYVHLPSPVQVSFYTSVVLVTIGTVMAVLALCFIDML